MIVDEHDCQSTQEVTSWSLLFPETMQFDTTTTTTTTTTTADKFPMHENHINNNINTNNNNNDNDNSPVISIDAIDVIKLIPDDTRTRPRHHKSTSASSSSSSSESSSEDLIFEGERLLKQSSSSTSKDNPVLEHTCVDTDAQNIRTCSYVKPEEILDDIQIRTPSPLSLHSPPVQEMRRDEGYDAQRIPATVFMRSNSIAPQEWSVASNDSLFSLHIGTSSIDREQSISINGELKKQGISPTSPDTLFEDDEVSQSTEEDLISESSDHSLSLNTEELSQYPPTTATNDAENKKHVQSHKIKEENPEMLMTKDNQISKEHRPSVHSSSISLRSNTSEDSNFSFAFPLLEEGEKNMTTKGQSQQSSNQPQQKPSHKNKWCSWLWCCSCFSCLTCYNYCYPPSSSSCFSCFSCKSLKSSCCCCCSCLWTFCSSCIHCKFCSCCTSKSTSLKCC